MRTALTGYVPHLTGYVPHLTGYVPHLNVSETGRAAPPHAARGAAGPRLEGAAQATAAWQLLLRLCAAGASCVRHGVLAGPGPRVVIQQCW